LKQSKTILIFSEGICANQWKLRSLKKGTSRLGLLALENNIKNIRIKPISLNYSSFTKNPKDLTIHFEKDLLLNEIDYEHANDFYRKCNLLIKEGIKKSLIEKLDVEEITLFKHKKKPFLKFVFAFPALLGFLTHYLYYTTVRKFVVSKTKNTVFYDSVLFGILLITYPIFVAILSIITLFLFDFKIAVATFIALPALIYCYKVYKTI
jgi:hypothetical protein